MTDIPPFEQPPRIPGVEYVKETRYFQETTTIDGIPSTRNVPYEVDVPVPPKDWDEVILRGVTFLAMGVTGLASIGTTASVGGQLHEILHPAIAYGVGLVFTATWLACVGLEWVAKTDPGRAKAARNTGWLMLILSMAAVFSYGYDHEQPVAGAVGACLDLAAKGLWALVIHTHRVPLRPGVAHWLREREEQEAGKALLATRVSRLNRNAAYQEAVGGREYRAAAAIVTTAAAPAALPAPDVSGQMSVQVPVPPEPPVPPRPPVSGQPSGQSGPTPAPSAPQPQAAPSGQAAPVSGQPVPVAQVPSVTPPAAQSGMQLVGGSIAGTVRGLLAKHPEWEEDTHLDDLVQAVAAVHGELPKLQDTVRRSRDRDVKKREKQRKAS
ncbi:hypothetical protein [Streptomyces sp. NPDC047070]|uniref:hypothetical protein n=1 Tax=Streptomyces sp. NPDC047070 TaxID=3154923 RepID=UPI0034567D3B